MKSVVFDTNVLLDIFVFNDFRAVHLKSALLDKQIDAVASPKTVEEFADVISRPLFNLDPKAQSQILEQWRALARQIPDASLLTAPWRCQDPDDQVFLDLAFTTKPSILMSKDLEVLKLSRKAAEADIAITANYNID